MENLFNEVKELQKQGYSLRAIGENLGISKSKVHRILREGQEMDTSQNKNETLLVMSQSVPKSSQYDDGIDMDTENEVFVEKKPKKNGIREIKKREKSLKNQLDDKLQELIDFENFTADELEYYIKYFTQGKVHSDDLYDERLELDSNSVDNASYFLTELIRFLKEPVRKMKSFRPNELLKLKERNFKFVESVRSVEYDDEELDENEYEEDEDSDGYEEVVAVQLFSSRYDSMKDRIEEFLEAKLLNDIEI